MECDDKLRKIEQFSNQIGYELYRMKEGTKFKPENIKYDLIGGIKDYGGNNISSDGEKLLKRMDEELNNLIKESGNRETSIVKLIDLSRELHKRIMTCCQSHKCKFCHPNEFHEGNTIYTYSS